MRPTTKTRKEEKRAGRSGLQSINQSVRDRFIPISPRNALHLCHNTDTGNQSIRRGARGGFTIWFTKLIPHFYTPSKLGGFQPASQHLLESWDGIGGIEGFGGSLVEPIRSDLKLTTLEVPSPSFNCWLKFYIAVYSDIIGCWGYMALFFEMELCERRFGSNRRLHYIWALLAYWRKICFVLNHRTNWAAS